ncbi:helix-turn-helix domain-containing protein [Nocardia amikacinitolerans]|uniref:helix-turn-helix domain-containing protein n=1 Tax=Nocardia amikacinitolerans TaxID=756689 RepID=UPI0036B292B4
MSRNNLRATLDAVEVALGHLATALGEGGFDAGSRSYRQMSEIVMGQRVWATEHGIDEFDDQFSRVTALASRVYGQLIPYVEAMDRLRMLTAISPPEGGVEPGSREAKVLKALEVAGRPQSTSQLRNAVGLPSSQMRKLLTAMVARGLVAESSSGSRTLYGAAP